VSLPIEVTELGIPNSVKSIDEYAFYNCSSLANITIPNSVSSIGYGAFGGNNAWLKSQPDGLVYAGLVAYYYKGTMPEETHITLRDGTLGIAGAFENCRGLASITIPNTVTSIGRSAFYQCTSLTNITMMAFVSPVQSENAELPTEVTEYVTPP